MARAIAIEFLHHALIPAMGSSLIKTIAADVLAMQVTHPYIQKTTGADAEAGTLANGKPGQVLIINLVTDGGGTMTLTPVTKTGWATAVFADAGDVVVFMYVDDTAGWIILSTYGLTAQPTITV